MSSYLLCLTSPVKSVHVKILTVEDWITIGVGSQPKQLILHNTRSKENSHYKNLNCEGGKDFRLIIR